MLSEKGPSHGCICATRCLGEETCRLQRVGQAGSWERHIKQTQICWKPGLEQNSAGNEVDVFNRLLSASLCSQGSWLEELPCSQGSAWCWSKEETRWAESRLVVRTG